MSDRDREIGPGFRTRHQALEGVLVLIVVVLVIMLALRLMGREENQVLSVLSPPIPTQSSGQP